MDQEELDFTKLKYVLYARKSRTDEFAQVRSIPDQIFECRKLQSHLGLNVVAVLEEAQSAKKPRQRRVFDQMIKDIRAGKYDAILAWNPDRLARNMLEAGLIIDMIDTEIIKDLKFVTHHFTKDANGKMLLGMSFVLSKQYSDDLSQKVTRGVRRRHAEGLTSTPKHGYVNEEGVYKPDGKNFDLICEAWQMRKTGTSLEVISDWLNKQEYSKTVKRTGEKIDMNPKILSDIFKEPFYYGMLVQADQTVDLRKIYGFQPAVSEETFFAVQQLSYRRIKPSKPHKMAFYPFRLMVHCSYCGQSMRVGPSSGKTKRYLYFRCDNLECKRKTRSIRSKIILDFIYQFLEGGLNLTEADYNEYYQGMTEVADENRQKIRIEIHRREGTLKTIKLEIRERSLAIPKLKKDSPVRRTNEERVAELEQERIQLEQEVEELNKQLTDPDQDRLSIQQFLNLSKNASVIVQSASPVIKDAICREIFLNFSVDEEKVLSYQLKSPFDEMLKLRDQRTSRGERN